MEPNWIAPAASGQPPPEQYRTAYQDAVLRRRQDLVNLLAELGASTDVSAEDRAVAAIAQGEPAAEPLPDALGPDAQEVLILAALRDGLERVVAAVGPNFCGHVGGGPPGTLLHHACWTGRADVVRRLLELGADPIASSGAEYDTPVAWAALGSQAARGSDRDYVAVVEVLVEAGAELEPRFVEVATGPLADWLDEHL